MWFTKHIIDYGASQKKLSKIKKNKTNAETLAKKLGAHQFSKRINNTKRHITSIRTISNCKQQKAAISSGRVKKDSITINNQSTLVIEGD